MRTEMLTVAKAGTLTALDDKSAKRGLTVTRDEAAPFLVGRLGAASGPPLAGDRGGKAALIRLPRKAPAEPTV